MNEKRSQALIEANEKEFHENDLALMYDPTTMKGKSRKLTIRWRGPFVVIQKHSALLYYINIDGKSSLINKHRLRLYKQAENINENLNDESMLLQELQLINDAEQELKQKYRDTQYQLEIVKARQELENNNIKVLEHTDKTNTVNKSDVDIKDSDIQMNHYYVQMNF